MGIYFEPKLLAWFTEEYTRLTKLKPDMGKGCIRFKKANLIPYSLIGDLVSRISVSDWITNYEKYLRRN